MTGGKIRVRRSALAQEREPLCRPFGFKGAHLSELWQTAVLLESEAGHRALGLGTQSVLWSDPAVFISHPEREGNELMAAATDHALQCIRDIAFDNPIELLDQLLPDVYAYAQQRTGRSDLRKTFALNALVPVDNAAWLLYGRETDALSFDAMIPEPYRSAFAHRHERVACLPVVDYDTPVDEVERAAREGFFCFKMKLGHPGDQAEMLQRDKKRLEAIHAVLGSIRTDSTSSGAVRYYLDANGRYEQKPTLRRLLDHADSIGALERIEVIEEPFPESFMEEVGDLPVRIAADESAHTDADARERIGLGYGTIALKPVAKTLSMTLKIARVASKHAVPCFCADLTVNPILVDWNKMVAARTAPLPGLDAGLLEANGRQLYRNWSEMERYHPHSGASWTRVVDGTFRLTQEFYDLDGGIFDLSPHYLDVVSRA